MSSSSPCEIRVKFLTKNPAPDIWPGWKKFFSGGHPVLGRCRFLFHRDEPDYDWLVVYDDLPASGNERFTRWIEPLRCPRSHTLLITTEPSTIKIYGRAFLCQFGHVLTSQEPWIIRHPGAIYRQPGLIRFYEGDHDTIAATPPESKTALISTVCSTKRQTHTLHRARYDFTQRLKASLPELEIFGHGVRPIARKNEALDTYRYHVAIENHIAPHHWTEKLSDSFLSLTLPFYYGAPNATDYFPAESFIPIDIFDFDATLASIRSAIASGEYERRLPALHEARRLVLERWGTFPQLVELIESLDDDAPPSDPSATILSRHALRATGIHHAVGFACEKIAARMRHALIKSKTPSLNKTNTSKS